MRSESYICSRDRHLFSPGPKRILALDGGGVRGAITVAFLERIEQILDRQAGSEVKLADYFDLIGGTSTGAIIAGALALGARVSEIRKFYEEQAHLAFKETR
jgi:patatin-like phospholipase/acyl hydrolase